MQLTVLVENFCQNQKLRSEWGYSLYLSDPSTELLLDTGGYQHSLVHNASVLGLKWQNLQHIVLSHGHFDHTAGLMDAIRLAPQAQIWAGPNIEKPRWSDANQARNGGGGKLFSKVIDHTINPWAQITPSVIAFTVPEQDRHAEFINQNDMWEEQPDGSKVPDSFSDDISLLVKGSRGYSIVLGCAHSGLPNILHYAQKNFGIEQFDTVLGGTHLCSVSEKNLKNWVGALSRFNIKRWRPNHCTGFHAAACLAKHFKDVLWAGCGTQIEL